MKCMPYVSVQISDGLGNRLFHVAAMLGYAEKHGHTPVFVEEWIKKDTAHAGPKSIQEFFPEIPILQIGQEPWTTLQLPGDAAFTYVDLPNHEGNVKLVGCFQSERYFPRCGILLPKLLREVKYDLPYENCAFLHIRRGDYLSPYTVHHRVDLEKYYERALMALPDSTAIVVCSDDIDWCKFTLPRKYGMGRNWVFLEGVDDYITMAIMSRCAIMAICANSTFSWWGAYFGCAQTKVFPDVWGYPPLPVPVDLYPAWGMRLPVK
jgi:hypothetical protein